MNKLFKSKSTSLVLLFSVQATNTYAAEMDGMSHHSMGHAPQNHSEMVMQENRSMQMAPMQGGDEPEDARDPHAYSAGITLESGPYRLEDVPRLKLADQHNFWAVTVDRLEGVSASNGDHGVYDVQAWMSTTYNRAVLKAEGEIANGTLDESETALLYSHAVSGYWDLQAGVRHDSGEGDDRTWAGIGIQGLSPYWIEIDAGLYAGESGRSLLQVEAEYDLLLTQQLILQPRVEMKAYGKNDPENGIGSGLSSIDAGLRLRYEINRQFAPYIGVEWQGKFGNTADYTRSEGDNSKSTVWLAGIRFWF